MLISKRLVMRINERTPFYHTNELGFQVGHNSDAVDGVQRLIPIEYRRIWLPALGR